MAMETRSEHHVDPTLAAFVILMIAAWAISFWLFMGMDGYRKSQVKSLRADVKMLMEQEVTLVESQARDTAATEHMEETLHHVKAEVDQIYLIIVKKPLQSRDNQQNERALALDPRKLSQ